MVPRPAPASRASARTRSSTPRSTLLIEVGYDRLTMDAVAREARASKATLYRRWETKASLVDRRAAARQGGPARRAARHRHPARRPAAMFCGPRRPAGHAGTRALGAVVTALPSDPEFADGVPRPLHRAKLAVSSRRSTERAQARGEIGADVDLEVIGPALAGILLHRALRDGPARPTTRSSSASSTTSSSPPSSTRSRPAPPPRPCERARNSHERRRHDPETGTTATTRHAGTADTPPRLGARPDLGRPADGGARRHHRQHRPALHPRGPEHQPGQPASGSSPATRWPSVACCCSAARLGDLYGRRRIFMVGVGDLRGRLGARRPRPERDACCSAPGACRASAPRSPPPPRWR